LSSRNSGSDTSSPKPDPASGSHPLDEVIVYADTPLGEKATLEIQVNRGMTFSSDDSTFHSVIEQRFVPSGLPAVLCGEWRPTKAALSGRKETTDIPDLGGRTIFEESVKAIEDYGDIIC
jgi:hypothetical protein